MGYAAGFRPRVEPLQVLINCKASIDLKEDTHGRTALMIAAMYGGVDTLQVLINSNASLDLKDEDGETALDLAQEEGQTKCAKLLIAAALEKDLCRVAKTEPVKASAWV